MSLMLPDGSPSITTRSACLPTASVPILSPSPRNSAPFEVAMCTASRGVNPASTSNSTSRWSPNPAITPPYPVGSSPASSKPPCLTNSRSNSSSFLNSAGQSDFAALFKKELEFERSEEHTSELQSPDHHVFSLLLDTETQRH